MDYSFYTSQAQAQPHYFSTFPPTPAHSFEPQDDPSANQDFFQDPSAYTAYDPAFQFDGSFLPQEQPHHQQSPPISSHRHSVVSLEHTNGSIAANGNAQIKQDYDNIDQGGGSHSSGEEGKDSLTPAQQRRKVQNRAAQRAFRERKERHVKDLESKLNSLSAHSSSLLTDNERLKRELQRLATQNEILRATQGVSVQQQQQQQQRRSPSPVHGPQTYSPTDFATAAGLDLERHPLSYENFGGEQGNRLLAAGATWDLIQSHDLYRRGMVDIADVCRRLKGRAMCDGRGPAFMEAEILKAIEDSALSGSDELI